VFEGHDYQNPKRLKKFITEKEITHPVGLDQRCYGRGGTPEMAIIDNKA